MDSITLLACHLKSINFEDGETITELLQTPESKDENYNEQYKFSISQIEPDFDENHKVCNVCLELQLVCETSPIQITVVVDGLFAYLDTSTKEDVLATCLMNLWPIAQDALKSSSEIASLFFKENFNMLNEEEFKTIAIEFYNGQLFEIEDNTCEDNYIDMNYDENPESDF